MFANLTYQDKQAFFALLDEYFESRPHLVPGGSSAPATRARGASASQPGSSYSSPPATSPPPGRAPPPVVPRNSRPGASPAFGAAAASGYGSRPGAESPGSSSSAGAAPAGPTPAPGAADQAKSFMASGVSYGERGIGKTFQNKHVSGALGKVGAGGFADKMGTKFSASGKAPPPPVSRGPQTGPRTLPPAVGVSRNLPPPTRRDGFGASAHEEPAPAYAPPGKPQAQALFDYDGGDDTDLPVQTGQIVGIVAKTSADWWTCEDANGKQGLVPANYMKEL